MKTTTRQTTNVTSILNYLDAGDAFSRQDERDDKTFYATNRFVQHLDDTALKTVAHIIGQLITMDKPVILDLMAAWDSHIPDHIQPEKVVGLGLNENELKKNPRLDEYIIHDLNSTPTLPFPDNMFDAVINTVSVDYLVKPFDVFREIARVLKPGGLNLVIFSNRWFPKKVVKIWQDALEDERLELVTEYFSRSNAFQKILTFISMGLPRPATDKYTGSGLPSDPVFAVYALKKSDHDSQLPEIQPPDSSINIYNPSEIENRKKEIKNTLRCPYCDHQMKKWIVPDNPFIEWDNEFFYICFNDECPYLVRGWKSMYSQGNRGMSHRLGYNPDRDVTMAMPVHNLHTFKDEIEDN